MSRGGTVVAVALTLALSPAVAAAGQTSAQPDLAILGRGDAFLIGDDLHNADGVGQQRSLIAGRHATFEVVLENEGDRTESFVLHGSVATSGFHVTYHRYKLSGSRDLTVAMVGDGCRWTMRPHSRRSFTVFVDADPGAPLGAVQHVVITATSTTDPSLIDAVRATITNVSTPVGE